MRINFRYGAAVGILAAAFSTLGLVAAQAGQTPVTPVPTGAGAISVQAPAPHLTGITVKSVVLSSTIERSAWQHGNGIAQREGNSVGNGQERLGLPGQQNRMLVQSDRCNRGYDRCGYGNGRCCGYGNGYGHGRCYGYDHGRCCGYGNGYGNGYDYGRCCGYGNGYDHGYGNGYDHGRCCGYGYDHGRCVSHFGA
jgi:hypothetical protein